MGKLWGKVVAMDDEIADVGDTDSFMDLLVAMLVKLEADVMKMGTEVDELAAKVDKSLANVVELDTVLVEPVASAADLIVDHVLEPVIDKPVAMVAKPSTGVVEAGPVEEKSVAAVVILSTDCVVDEPVAEVIETLDEPKLDVVVVEKLADLVDPLLLVDDTLAVLDKSRNKVVEPAPVAERMETDPVDESVAEVNWIPVRGVGLDFIGDEAVAVDNPNCDVDLGLLVDELITFMEKCCKEEV